MSFTCERDAGIGHLYIDMAFVSCIEPGHSCIDLASISCMELAVPMVGGALPGWLPTVSSPYLAFRRSMQPLMFVWHNQCEVHHVDVISSVRALMFVWHNECEVHHVDVV